MVKTASNQFLQAICNVGSIVVTCGLCGRTHFSNEGDFDPGEQEELRRKQSIEPTKFKEWDCDSISYGQFDGKIIVPDCCEECNAKIIKYEQWVISHQYTLAKFLNARAKELVRSAKMEAEMITVGTDEF